LHELKLFLKIAGEKIYGDFQMMQSTAMVFSLDFKLWQNRPDPKKSGYLMFLSSFPE